jgi:pyruvate/2-oxoacid:ferredoxin oxidoreductase alpha subunit
MDDGFDIKQFSDFEDRLLKLANKEMPRQTKAFLKKEGTKLKKQTVKKANQKVKKRSGNYIESIKRGKVYNYDDALSIRVYSSSPEAHLLEYAHRQVTKDGTEIGFVKGFNVFEDSEKEFESSYYNDCQQFIDDVLDKGL